MKLEHEQKADDDEIRFADDDDSEIRVPEPTHGNEQVRFVTHNALFSSVAYSNNAVTVF